MTYKTDKIGILDNTNFAVRLIFILTFTDISPLSSSWKSWLSTSKSWVDWLTWIFIAINGKTENWWIFHTHINIDIWMQFMDIIIYTFSIRFHSGSCIDGVSKETISGHFSTNDASTNWTCRREQMHNSILSQHALSSLILVWIVLWNAGFTGFTVFILSTMIKFAFFD